MKDNTHQLPELPYPLDSLQPVIDAQTMEIHHSKHHAGYVDKLNVALANHPELRKRSIEDLLRNLDDIPEEIRTAVRNNGGGHANHSLFWRILSPEGARRPVGELEGEIANRFGGFDSFRKRFTEAATGRFGSGWAWLVVGDDGLDVISTPNQDSPLMDGKVPVVGLDVWEHAYYLTYQNRRADYVDAWWEIVDWNSAARNFEQAMAKAATA